MSLASLVGAGARYLKTFVGSKVDEVLEWEAENAAKKTAEKAAKTAEKAAKTAEKAEVRATANKASNLGQASAKDIFDQETSAAAKAIKEKVGIIKTATKDGWDSIVSGAIQVGNFCKDNFWKMATGGLAAERIYDHVHDYLTDDK